MLTVYGINPFSLHTKKVLNIFKTLQSNYPRQLQGLNLNSLDNAAKALLERCIVKNIQITQDQTHLLTDLSSDANYLAAGKEDIAEAISDANIERHIIDLNCQIFRTLLFERDPSNIQHTSLSGVGKNLIGNIIQPTRVNRRSQSSLGMHIYTGMHEHFWKLQGENSPRISSADALLSKFALTPLLLNFASDELLNNSDFIKEAGKLHSHAYFCASSQVFKSNQYQLMRDYVESTNKVEISYTSSALKVLESLHRDSQTIAYAASYGAFTIAKTKQDLPILTPLFSTKKKVLRLIDYWNPAFILELIEHFLPTYLKHNLVIESKAYTRVSPEKKEAMYLRFLQIVQKEEAQEILCEAYTTAPPELKAIIARRLLCIMSQEGFLEFIFHSSIQITQEVAGDILLSNPPAKYISLLLERLSNSELVELLINQCDVQESENRLFIELVLQKLTQEELTLALELQPLLRAVILATKEKALRYLDYLNPTLIIELLDNYLPDHLQFDQDILCKAYTKVSPAEGMMARERIVYRLSQKMPKEDFMEFVFNNDTGLSESTAHHIILSNPPAKYIDLLVQRLSSSALLWLFKKERLGVHNYDPYFINQALKKIPPQGLTCVLQDHPQLREHLRLTEELLDGLAMQELCDLIKRVPHLRSNEALAHRLFAKNPEFIPKIFKALAPYLRSSPEFIYATLAQCPERIVPLFYKVVCPVVRKMPGFLRAVIEKTQPQFVTLLIETLSSEYKQELSLMIELVRKCTPTDIIETITRPHISVKKNPLFILAALECCPASAIQQFCSKLEKSIRNDPDVAEKVLAKCPVDERSFVLLRFSREIQNEYKKRDLDIPGQLQPTKKPRNL